MEHRYILSMGHRNDDKGGAVGEFDWTPAATRAIRDAIKERGGKAWIIQEEDGGPDKSMFGGGLRAAAARCVELAGTHGKFNAYISCHYNSPRGFHAIFPDDPTDDSADVKDNNPLDVRLCRAMAASVKATDTVPLIGWPAAGPGVMSERETRVGEDGDRLGEMLRTAPFRMDTARVVIEAGGIASDDRRFITNPSWVRDVYAVALVDALEEVFGPMSVAGGTRPSKRTPVTVFAEPVKRPWLERLRSGESIHEVVDGEDWYAVNRLYRSIREDERRQFAMDGSALLGENVPAGTVAGMTAIGKGSDGEVHLISDWDTVFDADDWAPVPWPEVRSEQM